MSKVKIQGNASGTGVVTLTAPNTNTDRTITLPDETVSLTGAPAGLDDVGGVARATSGLLFNGDTAAANALDDYEAGTWTPTVEGDATGVLAAPTNSCYYTKIGNTVHIVGSIRVTTNFTANVIGGLPYATSYAASPSSVISLCNPLTSTSDDITMGASRTTTKVLFYNDQSVASDHNLNTISGYYRFSFSYRTA